MIKSGIITDSGTPSASDMRGFATLYLTSTYDGTTTITTGKLTKSRTRILGTANWLEENFTYDSYGRVGSTSGNNHLDLVVGSETVTNTYDFADNLLTSERTSETPWKTLTVRDRFTYDDAGRLLDTYFRIGTGAEKLLSHQYYTDKDELREKNLGFAGSAGWLQSVDYSYNAQGWLKAINQSNLGGSTTALSLCATGPPSPGAPGSTPDNNDLFYLELYYDQLYSGMSGTTQKNGNISQMVWRTRGRDRQAYSLRYDYLNRLTYGNYYDIRSTGPVKTDDYYTRIQYADARGNISELDRQGWYDNGSCWTSNWIDILDYSYFPGTNRLKTVTDVVGIVARPSGFDGSSSSVDYQYDDNGNQTYVPNRDVTIDYNHLNLPEEMDFPGTDEITILYDATGTKLQQTIVQGGVSTTRDYLGKLEYVDDALESIHHSEGRVASTNGNDTSTGLRYEYNLTDHLGNVRIVFADLNGNNKIDQTTNPATNEVLQENHYYPFGMRFDGPWAQSSLGAENKYGYNDQEFTSELGLNWNDYGARWYDSSIGRWNAVDPVAERFLYESPFVYAGNDPTGNLDVGGMYKLPAEFINKFPQIAKYIQNNIREDVMNSSLILEGFARFTKNPEGGVNLTPEAVDHAVTYGSGPTIVAVDNIGGSLDAHGYYDPSSNSIQLKEADLKRLELTLSSDAPDNEKLRELYKTFSTILHETVHYGDYLDGKRQDGEDQMEPGNEFEIFVWGIRWEGFNPETDFPAARYFGNEKYSNNSLSDEAIEFFRKQDEKIKKYALLPTLPN